MGVGPQSEDPRLIGGMPALDDNIKDEHAQGERGQSERPAARARREDCRRRDHAEEAKQVDRILPLRSIYRPAMGVHRTTGLGSCTMT